MSKLAHSHQPTMNEIDRRRAIENGDEDLLEPAEPLPDAPQGAPNTSPKAPISIESKQ